MANVSKLIDAQIELNGVIGRSADAFNYGDGLQFERRGQRLKIVAVDVVIGGHRESRRLKCLHGYWRYRAMDDFLKSDAARERMGRPDNEDATCQLLDHAVGRAVLDQQIGADAANTDQVLRPAVRP